MSGTTSSCPGTPRGTRPPTRKPRRRLLNKRNVAFLEQEEQVSEVTDQGQVCILSVPEVYAEAAGAVGYAVHEGAGEVGGTDNTSIETSDIDDKDILKIVSVGQGCYCAGLEEAGQEDIKTTIYSTLNRTDVKIKPGRSYLTVKDIPGKNNKFNLLTITLPGKLLTKLDIMLVWKCQEVVMTMVWMAKQGSKFTVAKQDLDMYEESSQQGNMMKSTMISNRQIIHLLMESSKVDKLRRVHAI
jgi:hypothetical protein